MWLCGILLITGCFIRQTPAEEMYNKLEEVVQIEKAFEEQQEPIVLLEREEKDLYEQMIKMNNEENYDEIVELVNSALKIAEKRKEHIDIERKSIEESKAAFSSVQEMMEKLDDAELKTKAAKLYELMQERYDVHGNLYKSYEDGLTYDTELYHLLKEKNIEMKQLEMQVTKVNGAYEEVLKYNEIFNEKTKEYNEIKLDFYQTAGLNVQVNMD
nr:YkyA family protein [Bacillus sp. B15-48]